MDNYQPIYDAVRSRLSNCDVGKAVQDAIGSGLDASQMIYSVGQEFLTTAMKSAEPCVLYRPSLSIDGNKWCALYGDNLQDGVAGFGDSPELAMMAFNKAWSEKLPVKP